MAYKTVQEIALETAATPEAERYTKSGFLDLPTERAKADTSGEERQLAALEGNIGRFEGDLQNPDLLRSVANLRDRLGAIGGDVGAALGGGGLGGSPGEDIGQNPYLGQAASEEQKANVQKQTQQYVARLKQQQQQLREQIINKQLAAVGQQEKALTGSLLGSGGKFESAIDERLSQLLGDIGFGAGQARQQVGEAFSNRGLGRSTFQAQNIGEVTLQEQERKAQQRTEAYGRKAEVGRVIGGQLGAIQEQRRQLESRRNISELKAFQDQGFQIERQRIEMGFMQQLQDMELSNKEREAIFTFGGAAIGAIAGAFIGGAPGAAAGASGGAAAGGAAAQV